MKGRLVIFVLAVVFVVAGVGFLGKEAGERSEFTGEYASFSASPEGTRALFALAERMDLEPERLSRDFSKISETGTIASIDPRSNAARFLLFLFNPDPFSEDEIEAIPDWVAGGNTFLLMTDRDTELLDRFGVQLVEVQAGSEEAAGEEAEDAGEQPERGKAALPETESARPALRQLPGLADIEAVSVAKGAPLIAFDEAASEETLSSVRGFTPLLRAGDGRVVAAEVRYGQGRLVVVSSPYAAANAALKEGDNGLFLIRLLAETEGGVYFDEFHHGFTNQRSLSAYLRDSSLWIAVCQIGLLLLLLGWRVQDRFGSPLPFYEEELRGRGEAVRAMSLIYQQGGHDEHALGVLLDDLERVASEHLRLDAALKGDELIEAIRRRGEGELAGKIEALRERAHRAASGAKRRTSEVVDAARDIAALTESLR